MSKIVVVSKRGRYVKEGRYFEEGRYVKEGRYVEEDRYTEEGRCVESHLGYTLSAAERTINHLQSAVIERAKFIWT